MLKQDSRLSFFTVYSILNVINDKIVVEKLLTQYLNIFITR